MNIVLFNARIQNIESSGPYSIAIRYYNQRRLQIVIKTSATLVNDNLNVRQMATLENVHIHGQYG